MVISSKFKTPSPLRGGPGRGAFRLVSASFATSSRPNIGSCWTGYLLAAAPTGPVIEQLDPPRRAAVIMALLALVLIGLFLVTFVMVGAHWVRRLARHKPASAHTAVRSGATSQRLRNALHKILPTAKTADTIQIDASTKDTKIDR